MISFAAAAHHLATFRVSKVSTQRFAGTQKYEKYLPSTAQLIVRMQTAFVLKLCNNSPFSWLKDWITSFSARDHHM